MFSKSDKRFVDSHGNNDLPTMRHELEVPRKRATKLLRIEKLWPTESAAIVAETSQRYWIPGTIYLAGSEKKFPHQDFDTSSIDSAIFFSFFLFFFPFFGNLPAKASKPAALDVSLIESWNNVKLQIVPRLEK